MTIINNDSQISSSRSQNKDNSNAATIDGYNLLLAAMMSMTKTIQDASDVYLNTQESVLDDQNKKIAELSTFLQKALKQGYVSVSVEELLLAWDPTTQSPSTGYKIPWSQCPLDPAKVAVWIAEQKLYQRKVQKAIDKLPAGIEINPAEWNNIKNMNPDSTVKVRLAVTQTQLQKWSTENMQQQKDYSYIAGQITIDQQLGQTLAPTQTSAISAMQQFEDGFASILSTLTKIDKKQTERR